MIAISRNNSWKARADIVDLKGNVKVCQFFGLINNLKHQIDDVGDDPPLIICGMVFVVVILKVLASELSSFDLYTEASQVWTLEYD